VRKQLRRSQVMKFFEALPPCLIGMEACATAHYWARELTKLGHEVRLMPAKDVKAYVKRNKNDAADAEAICEAVRRPTMRFVRANDARAKLGRLLTKMEKRHGTRTDLTSSRIEKRLKASQLKGMLDKTRASEAERIGAMPHQTNTSDRAAAPAVASCGEGDRRQVG
jgi:transposase